jgi:hypothetical protein
VVATSNSAYTSNGSSFTVPVTLTQNRYRFYQNIDALKPTTPYANENTRMGGIPSATAIRIRMNATVTGGAMTSGSQAFTLEYAAAGQGTGATACSAAAGWAAVGAPGSATIWRGYTNAGTGDGTNLSGNPPTGGDLLLTGSDRAGTYESANNSSNNPYKVSTSEDVEYDWAIQNNGAAANTYYCFRMVKQGGTALTSYTNYPRLSTQNAIANLDQHQWATVNDSEGVVTGEDVTKTSVWTNDVVRLRIMFKDSGVPLSSARVRLKYYTTYADFAADTNGRYVPNQGQGVPASGDKWEFINNCSGTWCDHSGSVTTVVTSDHNPVAGKSFEQEVAQGDSWMYDWQPSGSSTGPENNFSVKYIGAATNESYRFRIEIDGVIMGLSSMHYGSQKPAMITTSTAAVSATPTITSPSSFQDIVSAALTEGIGVSGASMHVEISDVATSTTLGSGDTTVAGDGTWIVSVTYTNQPADTYMHIHAWQTEAGKLVSAPGDEHVYQRKAYTLDQSAYRWFNNANSTDVGTVLASRDTPATAPTQGTKFRLRTLTHVTGAELSKDRGVFKLQYSVRVGTCDASFTGESYGDVSATSGNIRYADNAGAVDGVALTANGNDPLHGADSVISQTYEEENRFRNTVATVSAGADGEWDFTLVDFSAPQGTTYCFRIVRYDGTVFDGYGAFPEITTETTVITLTVSTNGSQTSPIDSGSSNTHLGGSFTFSINSSTANVTGIKVSNTGDAGNLADVRLYYDTDGTYAGTESCFNTTCTDGGGGALGTSITGSLAMSSGNTYYIYVIADIAGTVAGGKTIDLTLTPSTDITTDATNTDAVAKPITGTTTIRPNVTSYTNTTDGTLTDGARETHTLSISGAGFGATCDGTNNKVQIGAYALSCTGATFANTTITIDVDSALPDTNNGGTGASGLLVTIGGTADNTQQTFYVYPTITGIIDDFGGVNDTAREYAAGDAAADNTTADLKDGEIQIDGNHFGASGTVTILGSTGTQAIVGTRCGGAAYSATCITVQVPVAISDSSYTGSVIVSQGGTKNSNSYAGFRVLPRITGITPAGVPEGDPVTIGGDHFCQNGGTCPTPPTGDVNNKVTFTSNVDQTTFVAWSNTAVATVNVPVGSVSGAVRITSNGYISNGFDFTVSSNAPHDPANLRQFMDAGLATALATTTGVASQTIYLAMTMQADLSGGTLYSQIEIKPTGTGFACGAGACGVASESAGVAGPGPVDCSNPGNNCSVAVSPLPSDGIKHWQARVRYNRNSTDYFSDWVSFNTDPDNVNEVDFTVDATGPAISTGPSAVPDYNGATISWSTSLEASSSQVQYNKAGGFNDDCSVNNDCTALADTSPTVSDHTVILSNLDSNTQYYYRVRSVDDVGNETIGNTGNFTTLTVNQPAKTAEFFITGLTGSISGLTTATFSIHTPETAVATKSAFIEITGISASNGTNNIEVQMNAQSSQTFSVNTNAAGTEFKMLYKVTDINVDPTDNTLYITPSIATYIASAKLIFTYAYTP